MLELGVRIGGKGELVRYRVPVDAARLEGHLAEHRVPRFVPEMPREVAVYLEARIRPLEEGEPEELDDVHLGEPHVEKAPVHLGRRGVEVGQASARVPEPRESLVAAWCPDELDRLARSWYREVAAPHAVTPGAAGGTEIRGEVSLPLGVGVPEGIERPLPPIDLLPLLELEEAEQPVGRLVCERISPLPERLDRVEHARLQHAVDAGQKLPRRARADELLEERLEREVVRPVEVVRRLPQLRDALPQPAAVLRVLPEVERQSALRLPFRNGVQLRAEHQERPMLDPSEPPHEPHGLLDRRARTRCVSVGADACQGRGCCHRLAPLDLTVFVTVV